MIFAVRKRFDKEGEPLIAGATANGNGHAVTGTTATASGNGTPH